MFKKIKPILVMLPAILFSTFASMLLTGDDTKVEALGTQISVPSTINLNDASENEIRNYYNDLDGLSSEELKGDNLLKNLKPILSKNFTYVSYDNVWKAYEITDRNWDRAPAEEIKAGNYNSETNTITNYTYEQYYEDGVGNPIVKVLYRNDNDTATDLVVTASNRGNIINREHCWPQSRGFKASSGASGPAGTDLHHLLPADASVNQHGHNNYAYGEVEISEWPTSTAASNIQDNKRGTPISTSSLDEDNVVFEPQDCDKGDIARACFYMVARYNNLADEQKAISKYEPFLELVDYITSSGQSVSSSDTESATYGVLSTLLEWHEQDPVDEFEIHRNNLIYNNYQHNRNPFIDFPSWVDIIWGDSSDSADPNTDLINGISTEAPQELSIEGTYDTTIPFGSTFDKSGIKVYLIDNIEDTKTDVTSTATISNANTLKLGNQELSVTYGALKASIVIKVTNVGSQDYIGQTKATPLSDLIFSAYIEGSSNNKALEIFNGTGNSIDLSSYSVKLFSNGNTNPSNTLNLSGTLLNNETLVIVYPSSGEKLKSYANMESAVCNFNGNDTIRLYNNDVVVDQFGNDPTGVNPSNFTGEDANGVTISAADYSLLRISDLNVVGKSDTFTFSEWCGYSIDTFDILKTYKIEETLEVSAGQQAEAYANYFLESTQENCNQLIIQNADTWSDLKMEYEAMVEDAKDIFVSSDDNLTIADARTRYLFIINKYQTLEDFIKIGNQNRNLFANFVANGEILWLVVPIIILSMGGIALAIYISKEKAQK